MKTFCVFENFLSEKECQEIINIYNLNIEKCFQYRDTFPLNLSSINDSKIDKISEYLKNFCQSLTSEKILLDTYQIVKWPPGSFQDKHYDNLEDSFAVIIYLNEKFCGGKTFFDFNYEQIKITPETGKCVIFSSPERLHGVEKVQDSDRYTLAYWFVYEDKSKLV